MKTNYTDIKESIYKYRKTKKWLLAHIYNNQIWNSKRRWHNNPDYTLWELRDKYTNDIVFNNIYNKWIESWYNINLTPSLDRINPLIWYSLNNIQVITLKDNLDKWHKERNLTQWKRVWKFLNWNLIKEYLSITDAWRDNNIWFQQISLVCNKYYWRKTAWWYWWEFI